MKMKNWKKMVAMTMTAAVLSSGSLMMEMPKAEAIDWLKVAESAFNGGKDSDGISPIDRLADADYLKHMRKNMTDNEKLFMLAVSEGNIPVAESALNTGIDINGVYGTCRWGETAMHVAIGNNDRAMLQFLLSNGANVVGFYDYDNKFCSYLVKAADKKDLDLVKYLHEWGAPINSIGTPRSGSNDNTHNAMTIFSNYGSDSTIIICEYLLQQGIDVNYKKPTGLTPYIDAVTDGHTRAAELFAAYGADLSARDTNGRSASTIALDRRDLQMVAVVQQINARGQQPSHKK